MDNKANKILHDLVVSHGLYQISLWFAKHRAIIDIMKTKQGHFPCILCDISSAVGVTH